MRESADLHDGWGPLLRRLTRAFISAGATCPATALPLGGVGCELARVDAAHAVRCGWLACPAPGRFYVTARGRAGATGEAVGRRPEARRALARRRPARLSQTHGGNLGTSR
jgi:hypothetical protein